MNKKYLVKLQEDLRLKNYTKNTCDDYYRFVVRFLDFVGKDAMSISYADIRRFIFYLQDEEHKMPSQQSMCIPLPSGSFSCIP